MRFLDFTRRAAIAVSLPLLLSGCGLLVAPAVQAQPAAVQRGLPDFTDLVEQVSPTVVNIRTRERVRMGDAGEGQMDEEMREFFRRFFGVPLPNLPRPAPRQNRPSPQLPEQEVPRGVGSGFILSADGYVMTNAHVVDGADEVLVTLTDKREFKARIVGADKRTDVALVKIEATDLPFVRIGDVNRLRVGEWVLAIGSPFGLENTVTAGIVSAKQRDTGDYLPSIQTDVAVNPGNSGGPLINMRGEVVGINSQIYSRSGGFMGISFAIPIDEAMRVSEQLRSSGRVTRGRIGVRIDQVTREVAESIGLGRPRGALVRNVEADSPAEKAGVEAGDIIVRFDGAAIEKASDLPRLVGNTRPGTRSRMTVFRRGQERELTITIAELEPEQVAASQQPAPAESAAVPTGKAQALGLTVADLTAAERKELRLRHGVRVEAATDAAARAGLREGDIVLAVGNIEVGNVREFEAAVAKVDTDKLVNMLVQRGELVQFVLVRPAR
ncbi:MAG TPA: DegQ family serine endoprotease [Ottowia sp.]|uniref:DegQ family serine endoprotease n=1 Tax=Ottowia sp. TaxID=1898956 RepID=UPI002BAC7050|nr:DegQ family serine endoprotease [Ottowia sp.]HMN20468.1 DegQ family serine endoprotease [Ottowia sp.]